MQQLVFEGAREFALLEVPDAEPGPGEVIVEVLAAGICGSDVHGYAGLNDRRPPGTVMGHEVAARVLGGDDDEGAGFAAGDPVALWPIVACGNCAACRAGAPHLCATRRLYGCVPELPGGFATRMVVPAANLVALPADVPPELGALIEPLAVGHHAVGLAEGCVEGRVSVIGGGPIGIAAAAAARAAGAKAVTVVEPQAERRRLLARIGLDSVSPEDAPDGVELAIECVGAGATIRAALAATRPGGTVVVVGVAEAEVEIPVVPLVIEERRLLGSSAYTREDFEAVAAYLAAPQIDLAAIVEARTDLAGTPAAFEAYANRETAAVKTLVVPVQ